MVPTGFVKHGGENGVAEVVAEGGVVFRYYKCGPESGPVETELLAGVEDQFVNALVAA